MIEEIIARGEEASEVALPRVRSAVLSARNPGQQPPRLRREAGPSALVEAE